MEFRRIIAHLLLPVYLTLAVGPAVLSLSCECVASGGPVCDGRTHACCVCVAASDLFVAGPCCDDLHSTEIALYTAADAACGGDVRCAVIHLPCSLAAECPCPAHRPAARRPFAEPPAPYVPATELPAAGFRAPPASV